MKINETLENILKDYSNTVREGNDIVICLIDGVIFLEKGKSFHDPINIKIEPINQKIEKTIEEVFYVKG